MTVTEINRAIGSWTLKLRDDTPRSLLRRLEYLGHIAIVSGRVDVAQYGDNLLSAARYVGVYRGQDRRDEFTLKGAGMAFWLGDEDDKGDVFESEVNLAAVTFADAIRALLPPSGSITEGTLHGIAGTYTGRHIYQTPRQAIDYVVDLFGGTWRVNGNATLDAGLVEDLYVVDPRAVLVRKAEHGSDLFYRVMPGQMSMATDIEDYTTRVLLLAEGEGTTIATGDAELPVVPFKDLHGNTVKLTRLISESGTLSGNATARAQLQLNRFSGSRSSVSLSTSDYDVKGDFVVGDYVYVYDPDTGFVDDNTEIVWKGQPINPMALRCIEMTWPVRAGWTVAFRRSSDGAWIDLSDYFVPETGETTVVVGEFNRSLVSAGGEPIGNRPNTGGVDTSIPDHPEFIAFSTGSYMSTLGDGQTRSAIRAEWTTPLNIDSSTIVDGDRYEIRYRVNQVISYPTSWDTVAGYQRITQDLFGRNIAGGWGGDWTVVTGDAADFTVDGDEGLIAVASNDTHVAQLSGVNHDNLSVLLAAVTQSQAPVGGNTEFGFEARYVDANNFVDVRLFREADTGNMTLAVRQMDAGVETVSPFATIPGVVNTDNVWLRTVIRGNKMYARAWKWNHAEPTVWHAELTLTHLDAGAFRVRSRIPSSVTNVGMVVGLGRLDLVDITPAGYSWDDLGTWDAMLSDPIEASPEWQTAIVGWGTNVFTLTELTPGVQYELQIRAVDAANPPHFSAWSPSSIVHTSGDTMPPAQPAAPVVAASMIAIQVQHDLGRSDGGAFNLDLDLNHLNVHVGGSESFFADETNKVGELIATPGMVLNRIPAVGSFKIDNTEAIWVKVVAVDRAGNKSSASTAVQATVELIDNAHISSLSVSKLTAGTITAQAILASQLEVASGGRIKLTEGGMDVYNAAGDKILEFGQQSYDSNAWGMAVYQPGVPNPILEIGDHFYGYGMLVNNSSWQPQVEIGRLSDGDYGLAARDPLGELVKLSTLVFGPVASQITALESVGSGSWVNLATVGPTINVEIGDTGKVLLGISSDVNFNTDADGTQGGFISFTASGANSIAAGTYQSYCVAGVAAANADTAVIGMLQSTAKVFLLTGLNPGVTQFQMKYSRFGTTSQPVQFSNRVLFALPY